MVRSITTVALFLNLFSVCHCARAAKTVRIGIDGLSHDHIHGILNNHKERSDIQIVGIAESNKAKAQALRIGMDLIGYRVRRSGDHDRGNQARGCGCF